MCFEFSASDNDILLRRDEWESLLTSLLLLRGGCLPLADESRLDGALSFVVVLRPRDDDLFLLKEEDSLDILRLCRLLLLLLESFENKSTSFKELVVLSLLLDLAVTLSDVVAVVFFLLTSDSLLGDVLLILLLLLAVRWLL